MRAPLFLVAALALSGCGGEPYTLGLEQPLRVAGGTFKEGALPGSAPLTEEAVAAGAVAQGTHVTLVNSANNIVRPGQSAKGISGRVTDKATAVAVRFPDLGTGYWIVPSDVPDPAAPGELTWGMKIDFAQDLPPGLRDLYFAGIDSAGNSGTQTLLKMCVTSWLPDNLNACDPDIAPPAAVLSLAWDTDVDLDLQLRAPSGKLLDAKHPTTAPVTDAGVTPDAADGKLDRDSMASCVVDGVRRENVIWQEKPEAGQYLVYANVYAACGQLATRFTLTFHVAEEAGTEDQQKLVEKLRVHGEVLASDENGGSGPGLFVTELFIQ